MWCLLPLWHTPHGIVPPATPRSNYNYYLLYERFSPAKNSTLSLSINFYCCKRLLGRNNTTATNAPLLRVPAPWPGCPKLSNMWDNCYATSCTSSYRRWWSSPGYFGKTTPWEHSSYFHPSSYQLPALFFTQHLATRHSLLLFSNFPSFSGPHNWSFLCRKGKHFETEIYLINN